MCTSWGPNIDVHISYLISTSVDGLPPSKYFWFANSQGNCSSDKCLDSKKNSRKCDFHMVSGQLVSMRWLSIQLGLLGLPFC
jgi:hypothetical protein